MLHSLLASSAQPPNQLAPPTTFPLQHTRRAYEIAPTRCRRNSIPFRRMRLFLISNSTPIRCSDPQTYIHPTHTSSCGSSLMVAAKVGLVCIVLISGYLGTRVAGGGERAERRRGWFRRRAGTNTNAIFSFFVTVLFSLSRHF